MSKTPEKTLDHYQALSREAAAELVPVTTFTVAGFHCKVTQTRSAVDRDRVITVWSVVEPVVGIVIASVGHISSATFTAADRTEACRNATATATNVRAIVKAAVRAELAVTR